MSSEKEWFIVVFLRSHTMSVFNYTRYQRSTFTKRTSEFLMSRFVG